MSTLSYVMYYIVLEIYIGGRFLEDCFYCYSQQMVCDVAKESLIPYNSTQRNIKTETPNSTPNQINKCKIRLSFWKKILSSVQI